MDKHAAQRLLRGNGTRYTPAEWGLLKSVITAETDSSLPSAAEHARRDSNRVVRILTDNALCTWALHACPSLCEVDGEIRSAIERSAQFEFGACAQRKFALLELDRLAVAGGCQPIVIKGPANALVYYSKESSRPSRDIDIVVESADTARCLGIAFQDLSDTNEIPTWGDVGKSRVAGYNVEAHAFFISAVRWGTYHDLIDGSQPLPGCSALRYPNPAAAFTIALLHFAHHFGSTSFDLLDMGRMLQTGQIDIPTLTALWRKYDLVDLVLPGLTVLDTVIPCITPDDWSRLFQGLSFRKRQETLISLRLLGARRLTKFRDEWFNSRFTPPSFARRMLRRFFGSAATTQQLTGLHPRHPLFWAAHLLYLPVKRILFLWK